MKVSCLTCAIEFEKFESQIKKFPNHFCSRSCAAKHNNTLSPKRKRKGKCKMCETAIKTTANFCSAECKVANQKFKIPKKKIKKKVLAQIIVPTVMSVCKWHSCQQEVPSNKKFCCNAHKNNFFVDRRRKCIKGLAIELKGGKCQLCDYNKCNQVLQFHHLDPSKKDFNIGNGNTRSWSATKQELEKCILLCANCHTEVHAGVTMLPTLDLPQDPSP